MVCWIVMSKGFPCKAFTGPNSYRKALDTAEAMNLAMILAVPSADVWVQFCLLVDTATLPCINWLQEDSNRRGREAGF